MKIEKQTIIIVAETGFKRTLFCSLLRPQKNEEGDWEYRKGAMRMRCDGRMSKPSPRYFVWTEDGNKKLAGYTQAMESRQAATELYNKALIHLQSVQYREADGNTIERKQGEELEKIGYVTYNWHLNRYEWATSPLTLR